MRHIKKCLCPACCLIVFVGCSKSTNDWTAQLKAQDPAKRLQAIRALQERTTEAPIVVPALIEAMKDQNAHVRRDAAKALGKFGAEAKEAVPALSAKIRDPEPGVRKAVAMSLKQIDESAALKAGIK
jgi:HEAT repeat protein